MQCQVKTKKRNALNALLILIIILLTPSIGVAEQIGSEPTIRL